MTAVLVKGQNTGLTANQVRVTVDTAVPSDLSALLVNASGKVRSDADFIFYNQPEGPGVRCIRPDGNQPWRVEADLSRVPADIDKVRIVVSLDGNGVRFGQYAPPTARLADASGAELASFVMTGLDTESIVVALELYRRGGDWKVRAVGQGYAGGLADLIADHGVVVDEPASTQAAAPAAAPPPPPAAAPTPQYTTPPSAPSAPQYTSPPAAPFTQPPPPPPPPPAAPYPPPAPQPPAAPYPPQPPTAPYPPQPPTAPYPPQPPAAPYPPAAPPPPAPYPSQPPAAQGYPTSGPPAMPPQAEQTTGRRGAPVNLTKGQRVSLAKQDGSALTMVRMGLGWDPIKKRGMFGSREIEVDLDASAIMFADQQPVDVAFYNNLRSKDGSVMHTGDNLTGQGEGDDETILVDLSRVPAHVTTIFFAVTSYSGHTFQQIQNAFCRLVDETTGTELARYTLSGGAAFTAMLMAKMYREGNAWKMMAIGEGMQAKTPLDVMPMLGQFIR